MVLTRPRLLAPLARRDFALLTLARAVSYLGDGFFFVALAWQVYRLDNNPAALSLVGLAWTLPITLLLLAGGVASDRFERRRVMAAADVLRAAVIGLVGLLALSGRLRIWQLLLLMPCFGAGDAFFFPAATAIMPDLLPGEEITQANAVQNTTRPLMTLLLGPALAGFVVGLAGPGMGFIVDALSFLVSAIAVSAIGRRQTAPHGGGLRRSVQEIGEGLAYVRANTWCWATLAAALLSLLAFLGPWQVILPYLVKNELHAGPQGLGLIYTSGGVGSLLLALIVGQRGLPRRTITLLYLCWSIGIACLGLYGFISSLWQAFVVAFLLQAFFAVGEIAWATLLQRLVPGALLGRVSSLDYLVSGALIPLSYALSGPAAAAFGARTAIAAGGFLGGAAFLAFLLVPGVRDPERRPHGIWG